MSRVFRFQSHRRTGIFRNLTVLSEYDDEHFWYEPVEGIRDNGGSLSEGLHERDGHLF